MKAPRVIFAILAIALLALSGPMVPPLEANIQKSVSKKHGSASVKKSTESSAASLRILTPHEAIQVQRGGMVDMPIVMPPRMGASLEITVKKAPSHGHLQRLDSAMGEAIRYRYIHHRDSCDPDDFFELMIQDRISNDQGTLVKGRILIINPRADLIVEPEGLIDFGKTPLGCPIKREVVIQNRYGSTVDGNLTVGFPWSIVGESSLHLAEGDSKRVQLQFDPQATGCESCRLSMDNAYVTFPEIMLRGEGTPPFLIEGDQRISLSEEHPEAVLIFSNSMSNSLTVTLSGMPSLVIGRSSIKLSPMGQGSLTLSVAGTHLDPEFFGQFRVTASSGTYSQPLDLVIAGPKAPPTIELLRGCEFLTTTAGVPIRLTGIARNASAVEHPVDLRIVESGTTNTPIARTLILPPKEPQEFHHDWTSLTTGSHDIAVQLLDRGRLLDTKFWRVTVSSPKAPIAPRVIAATTNAPAGPHTVSSTPDPSVIRERAVIDQKVKIENGILFNHVLLQWRYYGSSKSGFVIAKPAHRNGLSDRTGEQEPNRPKPISGVSIHCKNGVWTARLLMPWPGIHEYLVYPAGIDQPCIAPITLQISDRAFYWPPLRAILLLLFIILLVKAVRRRDWSRKR